MAWKPTCAAPSTMGLPKRNYLTSSKPRPSLGVASPTVSGSGHCRPWTKRASFLRPALLPHRSVAKGKAPHQPVLLHPQPASGGPRRSDEECRHSGHRQTAWRAHGRLRWSWKVYSVDGSRPCIGMRAVAEKGSKQSTHHCTLVPGYTLRYSERFVLSYASLRQPL